MNKMTDILTLLRQAETGSPELSMSVFKVLHPEYEYKINGEGRELFSKNGRLHTWKYILSLTESVDAALAEVLNVGYCYEVDATEPDISHDVTLYKNRWVSENPDSIYCRHKSLPIAITMALIEARGMV